MPSKSRTVLEKIILTILFCWWLFTKADVTIVPHSVVPIILHDFHKSTQHGKVPTKTSRKSTNSNGSFSHRHHRSFASYIQGKQMGFNSSLLTDAICVQCSMKEKTVENVIQAYLSGILAHKGGIAAIFNNSGIVFKNKAVNQAMWSTWN